MNNSYQASIDYLYSLQLFGIKLGLDNIRELLKRLDNPQQKLRIIHIAGTNGKGSTAAALANIFKISGIKAGLYTSPHLHSFTERVRVDTSQISEAGVCQLVEEIRPHAEDLRATFFEFTTALALLCFQRCGCEWAILETGLGGRLDATNAVEPELCLLTPIAHDHNMYLGETLAEVAAEKAGILKSGVPAISARQASEAFSVLQTVAAEKGSKLYAAGRDYQWKVENELLSYAGFKLQLEKIRPTLAGDHQNQNLALAAAAASWLKHEGIGFSETAIRKGLEKTCWPGRLEWLPDNVLLDGAHNAAGAEVLSRYLHQQGINKVHLVIGLKADKQEKDLLSPLLPFVERLYATRPPVDESIAPEKLVQQAEKSGILAGKCDEPAGAIQSALRNRSTGQVLLIAGSLFLVAAAREELLSNAEQLPISI